MHPKKLLDQHNIDPKKSLGQNFLYDDNILRRIVDTAEVTPQDSVLEIGPGLGALTKHLAQTAKNVIAVELDDRLLPILEDELAPYDNVEVIHGDILEQDPAVWFADAANYKVVANVPYYITGAIFRHLLEAPVKPSRVVLTIQKEVAERLVAEPNKMSLLAVSVQFYGRTQLITNLSAGAFYPRPTIASSVLSVDLTQRLPETAAVQNEAKFFQIIKTGFSQKRKQLRKNLRALGYNKNQVDAFLAQANIAGQRRAETLSVTEWVHLYKAITAQ